MPSYPWCVPNSFHNTQATTLNAIVPAPHCDPRRDRHLAWCEELGELGMDIVRASHRETLRDLQPPPERQIVPGVTTVASAPPSRDAAFGQLFAVIARCVRQTMLLEDRFADPAPYTHGGTAPRAADPTSQSTPRAPAAHTAPDRLHPETLEDETLDEAHLLDPPETRLAAIRTRFDAAMAAGLTLSARPQVQGHRRPIPIIPPGPKTPLTACERSALHLDQQQSRKKPDG